jgi:hypothetical protein
MSKKCPCPYCESGATDHIHQSKRLRRMAAVCRATVDWDSYPKLRKIFEHRPANNNYWHELMALLEECQTELMT